MIGAVVRGHGRYAAAVGITREVRVIPAADYRPEGGVRGVELRFCVTGPDGAVVLSVATGWVSSPLALPSVRSPVPVRRGRPGIDADAVNRYPYGSGVFAHSALRRAGFCDGPERCAYLGGGPCFTDSMLIFADELIRTLVEGGHGPLWRQLEDLYDGWLVQRPVVSPVSLERP